MPKRRKNRKNRKGHSKKSGNVTNKENSTNSLSNDVMRTCPDDSFNKSKVISPVELVTPLRIPNPQLNNTDPFQDNISPIRTTPVNRKRSIGRVERSKYNSLNVTNLNFLFDSHLVNRTTEHKSNPGSDICVNESNVSSKRRSNSSIPKLHSPILEKLVLVSQGSQTKSPIEETGTLEFKKCNEVLETPKVSKVLLVDKTKSDGTPNLSNDKLVNNKINCEGNGKFFNGQVNINPYLNSKEINILNKDGSFGEISFFSPNLFQQQSSSTPIEKLYQADDVMEYDQDSLGRKGANDHSALVEKLDLSNNLNILTATELDSNVNNKKTPLLERVLNKEDNLRSLKAQTMGQSRRRCYKLSPKSNAVLSQPRVFNKKHTLTYSRLSISRRSSIDSTESVTRHNRSGIGEKLLTRLKKYTRISQRWTVKVVELCTHLGVQLKNSLSSMCNLYNDRSMIENFEKPTCKCKDYREEISNLNLKIDELTEEVKIIKLQLEMEKSNKENIEVLNQELNKMREELSQFKDIRTELESLKEQFKCLKSSEAKATPVVPPPPPPPPPPSFPPPPPPPLPPCLPSPGCNPLKISKKIKTKTTGDDNNSRPVISLDDILKVKLKKTSDRSASFTPTTRRLSQPIVSMDMLRQVKLRPASRPSFRPDTPDTGSSSTPTSPHSSLCRRNSLGKRERDGS